MEGSTLSTLAFSLVELEGFLFALILLIFPIYSETPHQLFSQTLWQVREGGLREVKGHAQRGHVSGEVGTQALHTVYCGWKQRNEW